MTLQFPVEVVLEILDHLPQDIILYAHDYLPKDDLLQPLLFRSLYKTVTVTCYDHHHLRLFDHVQNSYPYRHLVDQETELRRIVQENVPIQCLEMHKVTSNIGILVYRQFRMSCITSMLEEIRGHNPVSS